MIKVEMNGVTMDAETDDLKPCPICGSMPEIKHLSATKGCEPFWVAACSSETHSVYAYSSFNGTLDECVEAWNTRYHDGD